MTTTTSRSTEASQIIMSMKFMLQGEKSIIAMGILDSIENKMPATEIIKEVKDCINDNYLAMSLMLGVALTERIKSFKP